MPVLSECRLEPCDRAIFDSWKDKLFDGRRRCFHVHKSLPLFGDYKLQKLLPCSLFCMLERLL